jgi:ribosomal protein L29
MTGQEVQKLSDEQIQAQISDLRTKLFTLRQQSVTDKVEDLSQFKKIRRDIARLLTEHGARARKAAPAAKAKVAKPAAAKPASRKPAAAKTAAAKSPRAAKAKA